MKLPFLQEKQDIKIFISIKAASEDSTIENRSAFNRDDEQYPYRTHGQLFRTYYGLTFCILLILFNGWRSFLVPFQTKDFIVSYIGVSDFSWITDRNRNRKPLVTRPIYLDRCIHHSSCALSHKVRWSEPSKVAVICLHGNSAPATKSGRRSTAKRSVASPGSKKLVHGGKRKSDHRLGVGVGEVNPSLLKYFPPRFVSLHQIQCNY